jgi:hypothetical protein
MVHGFLARQQASHAGNNALIRTAVRPSPRMPAQALAFASTAASTAASTDQLLTVKARKLDKSIPPKRPMRSAPAAAVPSCHRIPMAGR